MPALFSSFKGSVADPVDVMGWIMQNVPCFKGPVPQDWTQAVYTEAGARHIQPAVIALALSMTSMSGYNFSAITSRRVSPEDAIRRNSQPGIYASDPGTSIATMKMLNEQFGIASANGNGPDMQRLAQQFANLLNAASPKGISDEEIVHGAPLIRRAIVWDVRSPTRGRGGDPSGGGPYRVADWVKDNEIDEDEDEAE
jgi:hypothetical protein